MRGVVTINVIHLYFKSRVCRIVAINKAKGSNLFFISSLRQSYLPCLKWQLEGEKVATSLSSPRSLSDDTYLFNRPDLRSQKSGTESQRWTSEPSRQFPFEFPQNYKICQQFPIPFYSVRAIFTPCWAHEILKRQFPAKWKLKFHGLLSHQCHPRSHSNQRDHQIFRS